jgi:hypothetical protein
MIKDQRRLWQLKKPTYLRLDGMSVEGAVRRKDLGSELLIKCVGKNKIIVHIHCRAHMEKR